MSEAVLVTGGAGYIGSHACKALRQAGYTPVTIDNLCLGHESFVQWGPLVRADIRDAAAVRAAIEAHDVKTVMHFAAFAYVGESVFDPAKYYGNNVAGTLGLLDGMRQTACRDIVFSSTCAVYGQPETLPITEDTPTRPVNPYGRSKLMCEAILADYAAAYGFRPVSLRYFNASGADPDGDVGELRDPETHLIPRAIMALQGYIDDFQVFGADFDTPDGTAIRDYIHVLDLAQGHVKALQYLARGANDVFNLGGGQGRSVAEVLDAIAAAAGRPLPRPLGSRRAGDPAALVADTAKARRVLGFTPTHSDLTTIVETAWRWHQTAHPRSS